MNKIFTIILCSLLFGCGSGDESKTVTQPTRTYSIATVNVMSDKQVIDSAVSVDSKQVISVSNLARSTTSARAFSWEGDIKTKAQFLVKSTNSQMPIITSNIDIETDSDYTIRPSAVLIISGSTSKPKLKLLPRPSSSSPSVTQLYFYNAIENMTAVVKVICDDNSYQIKEFGYDFNDTIHSGIYCSGKPSRVEVTDKNGFKRPLSLRTSAIGFGNYYMILFDDNNKINTEFVEGRYAQ